nr:STAS domain-containing protein [uncultured Methanoregula sp.]
MALCNVRTRDKILIVSLPLSVDHVAAMALEKELRTYLAQKPASLLCDMSGTTYVSSSGLRIFLTMAKMAKVSGIHFGFFSITPFVDHVFKLSGFKALFAIYPTEEDAVRAASAW